MLNRGRNVIVVTGAGGFLGSRVVPLVRRHAPRARVITVLRHRRPHARVAPGVEVIHGDLRLPAVWRRLPTSVTHVIHLAAAIPWDRRNANESSVVLDNVAPIAHLLDASTQWHEPPAHRLRLVGVGVCAERKALCASPRRPRRCLCTAPRSWPASSCSSRLRRAASRVAALRYSSIYGAGQYPGTVLPLLAERARRGLPLHVFNGRRVQDFLHVEDAARATWLACRLAARGAFNVGSGRPVSMSMLAREIIEAFDRTATSRVIEEARAAGSDAGIRMDVGRARRTLGFRARIDLRDGLRRLAREARLLMHRVLVTAVGGNIGQGVVKALRSGSREYFIVGTDMEPRSAGFSFVDRPCVTPAAGAQGMVAELTAIIEAERIEAIYVCSPQELAFFRPRVAISSARPARASSSIRSR